MMNVAELKVLLKACPDDAVVLIIDGYDQGMSLCGLTVKTADDESLLRVSFRDELRGEIFKATHVAILDQDGGDMEF
jgi:hypothetical protein